MRTFTDITVDDTDRFKIQARPHRPGVILRLERVGGSDHAITITLSDLGVVLLEQALAEHRTKYSNVALIARPNDGDAA